MKIDLTTLGAFHGRSLARAVDRLGPYVMIRAFAVMMVYSFEFLKAWFVTGLTGASSECCVVCIVIKSWFSSR